MDNSSNTQKHQLRTDDTCSDQKNTEHSCHKSVSDTNWVATLACRLGMMPSEAPLESFSYRNEPLSEDELDFLDKLCDKAGELVDALDRFSEETEARAKIITAREQFMEQKAAAEKDAEADISKYESVELEELPPEPVPISADMGVYVHISRDNLKAYCCVFPPIGEGVALTAEQIYSVIREQGIAYGLDTAVAEEVLKSSAYFKLFIVAVGKNKKDGIDGAVIDKFLRERKINISADDNAVDYKNLNWLQTVHAGDVICEIRYPSEPEDGMDVRGVAIKAASGKKPKIPNGVNTAVSEDGLSLVATCDGQLEYKNGGFRVDQIVNIDSDVNSSVGNLNVIGSVNVKGNVSDGFSIVATGDIVVRGIVEGAYLKAGGNIQIFHGMNGSLKGKLEANGSVTSKYLENCSVVAGGVVKSESIVNSTVISSDKVSVLTGKGIIIASDVTGFRGIEAKVIGNESNRLSSLTVGADPTLIEELQTLKREIAALQKKIDDNEKNLKYLEGRSQLDQQYQQLLGKIKFEYSVDKMKLAKKEQRIVVISDLLTDVEAQIVASEIYAPVNVSIGKLKMSMLNNERMCRIYKSEGDIVIGKK